MKNKYSSSNSIIYISIPHTKDDGRDDTITPVFASRESLLKALAECEHEHKGGNFLDNYRDAVTHEAELILKEYGNLSLDNLMDELSKVEINIEQVIDDVVWILFNYQDYLAVSLQDKELLADIAEDLIPSNNPFGDVPGFKAVEDCKDEYYWFIKTSEVPISNLCIFKNLTEDEIKLYKESVEICEQNSNEETLHTIYKLQAISAIRLAHKVKEGNF